MLTAGETTKELEDINQALLTFLKAHEGYTPKSQKEDFTFKYVYQYHRSLTNLLRIIPDTDFYIKENPLLTLSLTSLSSLIRNLWDIVISFLFHIRNSTSDEEFKYKNLLQHYLAESKRLQLLLKLNPTSPYIAQVEEMVRDAKDELITYDRFNNLEKKLQKDILKAERFSPPSGMLLEKIGIPPDFFSAVHVYLSNHTHYYAYGFSQDITFRLEDETSRLVYCRILEYGDIASVFFISEIQQEIQGSELFWTNQKDRISFWKDYFRKKLYLND
jgi:hypothetical protein